MTNVNDGEDSYSANGKMKYKLRKIVAPKIIINAFVFCDQYEWNIQRY